MLLIDRHWKLKHFKMKVAPNRSAQNNELVLCAPMKTLRLIGTTLCHSCRLSSDMQITERQHVDARMIAPTAAAKPALHSDRNDCRTESIERIYYSQFWRMPVTPRAFRRCWLQATDWWLTFVGGVENCLWLTISAWRALRIPLPPGGQLNDR